MLSPQDGRVTSGVEVEVEVLPVSVDEGPQLMLRPLLCRSGLLNGVLGE